MNYDQVMSMMEQYALAGKDIHTLFSDCTTLAAAGKTPLGLNQWVKSDKPLMEDFNEDNRIIDNELREQAQTLETLNEDNRIMDESIRALQVGKANIGAPKTMGLSLPDGVTGSISYSKDDFGRVYIHLHVQAAAAFAYKQVLAQLPVEYRPANLVYFMMGNKMSDGSIASNWGVITGSGDITAWEGANGTKNLVAQVSFIAK